MKEYRIINKKLILLDLNENNYTASMKHICDIDATVCGIYENKDKIFIKTTTYPIIVDINNKKPVEIKGDKVFKGDLRDTILKYEFDNKRNIQKIYLKNIIFGFQPVIFETRITKPRILITGYEIYNTNHNSIVIKFGNSYYHISVNIDQEFNDRWLEVNEILREDLKKVIGYSKRIDYYSFSPKGELEHMIENYTF